MNPVSLLMRMDCLIFFPLALDETVFVLTVAESSAHLSFLSDIFFSRFEISVIFTFCSCGLY
uniref:Uncharacterized protein n=1 Tax=Arundo donax TaxID=35708 RepID=A0A0A8YTQ9_ARUDO